MHATFLERAMKLLCFQSATMVTDVQSWLDSPTNNDG